VACNGDFSIFLPELLGQRSAEFGDFFLGNVNQDRYLASARGQRLRCLWSAIHHGTVACHASCAYFSYCAGGTPVNKLYDNGSVAIAEMLYCRSMLKRWFDVGLKRREARWNRGTSLPLIWVSESTLDRRRTNGCRQSP
jgi:uncharacterized protein